MKSLFEHKRFKVIFIASLVILIIFLIDWLTKYYFYDDNNLYDRYNPDSFKDYKVIGVRSLRHANTTFFSFLKIDVGWKWLLVIDVVLLVIFLIPLFFTKHKIFAFSLGILLGGMFGNTLDLAMTKGNFVRDIFYIPWHDRGTFNLADVFIVFGSGLTFLGIILTQFNFKKNKKKNEEEV